MLASTQDLQVGRVTRSCTSGRSRLRLGIRSTIFTCLLFASVIPVVGLYKWMERTAVQREILYVNENHLIIARNLASTMDRYANDVASVFNFTTKGLQVSETVGLSEHLMDFDLRFVALIDGTDSVVNYANGSGTDVPRLPEAEQLAELRALSASEPSQTVFSGVMKYEGVPHIFLVQSLANETFTLAALELGFLQELQDSIEFGELGHSMMVDQNGLVIAHPNAEWQAISKDASKLSVVGQMMAGETGVAIFYSPPMQADMISGFTFVPRTGWGVMVPQPMSELVARAKASESAALTIVLVEVIILATLSWWLSNLIATPIKNVVATAKAVSAGDLGARVEVPKDRVAITEAELLGKSFNQVLADLESDRNLLASSLDAAYEGVRAKSRFLAVMSHEIRTPMHGLMGILEIMEEGKLDDDQRQLLGVGQKAATNMSAILDDVLKLVKLDGHAAPSQNVEFNVKELVGSTIDLFQPLASQKGLLLTSSGLDQAMMGDPQMISQILLNLVGNAVKFTDKGSVHVSFELHGAGSPKPYLSVNVRDTGIGIPSNMQATIFDEFVQVDSDLSREQEGTGLGLAISTRLATALNGRITLESTPEDGSYFQLIVPVGEVGS
jgi:signal transduction histidine kinase